MLRYVGVARAHVGGLSACGQKTCLAEVVWGLDVVAVVGH
jgi:hypothetical protein